MLVVGGGTGGSVFTGSAQIYEPALQTWSAAGAAGTPRALHTATLLADGRVLVVGGKNGGGTLASAEIYDPVANAWTAAAAMSVPRVLHAATRMLDGKVLVTAGRNSSGNLASAEIYDPATNEWHAAASLPTGHSAVGTVLLPSGKVLDLSGSLYDPATNTWVSSIPLPSGPGAPMNGNGATIGVVLPDGRVLAAGSSFYTSAHPVGIYDPDAQVWTALENEPGSDSSITLLANGTVLDLGGIGQGINLVVPAHFQSLGRALLIDVALDTRTQLGSKAHSGANAAAASLSDGRVLVSGGKVSRVPSSLQATTAVTLYDPASDLWIERASMSTARAEHTATMLAGDRVLVTGGSNTHVGVFASAERYDPVSNAWTSAGAMSSPRYKHTATLLGDGRVLVAGGSNTNGSCDCTTFEKSVDLHDPATNAWSVTGTLLTARYEHTATRLPNGRILVTGGFGGVQDTLHAGGATLGSVEIYDPALGVWSAAAPMSTPRRQHTAVLLDSGLVVVAGGVSSTTSLASAEVYDPASNTWTPVTPMSTARQSHLAVRLSGGNVLVLGGFNNASSPVFGVQTAESYDPVADVWVPAGSMVVPRQGFIAAPLPGGRVVVVGGAPNNAGVPEFYE